MIHVNLKQVPVKVRALRRFTAPDPWRQGAATEWSITLFRMVVEDYAVGAAWKEAKPNKPTDSDPGPDGRDLKRDEVVGLETPDGGRRLLPRTLFRRWRTGGLPDQRLPGLLHQRRLGSPASPARAALRRSDRRRVVARGRRTPLSIPRCLSRHALGRP